MKFVFYRIDDNRKTSEIIQEVGVLKSISWIKAEWEEVSDQRVTNCFRECGFCNKAQDEVVPTLDQNEDEEFANLVKEVAGDVDPDNYVDFGKEEVDAGSICWRQEIRKETIEKHENPVDEVMHVSSDEDVDEEIEHPERIKSNSDTLQVMDKSIRFSHQFDYEELRESIVKVIEGLQDLQIWRRCQTKIATFFPKK